MARSTKFVAISPAQARAARALLNWNQTQLAEKAGVGLSTIVDFERERRVVSELAQALIRNALIVGGVEFTYGEKPGVRQRRR